MSLVQIALLVVAVLAAMAPVSAHAFVHLRTPANIPMDDGQSLAADVYLPEPRTVSSAMDMGGMKAVNIATTAALAQVTADVEKSMQKQGWKREMSMQTSGDSSTLIYSKEQRQAVYQLMKADTGGTQLAVRTGGS